MATQVFYRKWRPQRFADVVGQEYVTQTLLNALATGRVAHAYLFCGPRGTGKTSMGRILAKALNCLTSGSGEPCNECALCTAVMEGRAIDLIEIDAASNRGIDEMRSLREKVNFAPNEARYKVYIIDEVHMLTNEAFNAVLKTLEEPPPHAVFVLATTEPHKLPATVISRCQRFDFRRISLSKAAERLGRICQDEGVQAAPEVLNAIARGAGGSLRDAENMLEQLVVGYGQELSFEQLRDFLGLGGEQQVRELCSAALTGDVSGGLAAIAQAANDGLDLRQFHRQLMEDLRGVLLVKAGAAETMELPPEARQELGELADTVPMERIVQAVKLFGQVDQRGSGHSTLPLEMALVETATAPAEAVGAQSPQVGTPPPPAGAPPARPAARSAPPPSAPRAAEAVGAQSPQVGTPVPTPSEPREPVTAQSQSAETPVPTPSEPREPVTAQSQSAETPVPTGTEPAETPSANGPSGSTGSAQDRSGQAPSAASDQESPAGSEEELSEFFGKLKANWKSVIEVLRGKGQKFKVDALLRSGEPVSVETEAVTLGFPYQIFVDRMNEEMENPGTRRELEGALGGVLGGRREVRCIVATKEKTGGHLVRAAVEMGAKVVEDGG